MATYVAKPFETVPGWAKDATGPVLFGRAKASFGFSMLVFSVGALRQEVKPRLQATLPTTCPISNMSPSLCLYISISLSFPHDTSLGFLFRCVPPHLPIPPSLTLTLPFSRVLPVALPLLLSPPIPLFFLAFSVALPLPLSHSHALSIQLYP